MKTASPPSLRELWIATVDEVCSGLEIKLSDEWREVLYDENYIKLVVGGEGSAKSFHAGILTVCHMFFDPIVSPDCKLYWIVGADFEDAQKEFRYCFDFLQTLDFVDGFGMPASKTDQWWLRTKGGQRLETISGYDPTKVAREAPYGLVGAEFTRFSREVFDRCMGRINRSANKGGWGFFSGSYESSLGWLPDLIKQISGPNILKMKQFKIPSWANVFYYPGGREDPAILLEESRTSPERFQERFGAEAAPPRGIIFHEFRNTHHVDPYLEYDSTEPAYLFIDPGDTIYCVLFVQLIEGECRILEELYLAHYTHEQIIQEVKSRVGYPLVAGGTIDVGAKQAHMGMDRPIEAWRRDTTLQLAAKFQKIDDTIERVRVALAINPATGRPRLRVHPSCQGIISEMGGGPAPYPEGGPWMRIISPAGYGPPKKVNDHACKALGYGLASRQYEFIGERNDIAESVSYINYTRNDGKSGMREFMDNWFKEDDEA